MESVKNKTIYNDKLVQFSKKHLVYNGDLKNFKQYIYSDDVHLISDVTHFIIYYDSNNMIVHAEKLESIPKLQETKYEKLKKDLPKKIFDTNNNINVLCLEIFKNNKRDKKVIIVLQEELEDFLYANRMKYEHYIKETIGSFFGVKLFVMAYLSILIATVIKITEIVPLNLINDNEVLLTIKLVIGILLAVFSFFIILIILAVIFESISGFYSKYNLLFWIKMGMISFLLIYSITSIITSIKRKDTTNYFLLHNFAYNMYVDNKTSLVYDMHLQRPIIYLGSKDGIYYYYDSFDRKKLKEKFMELNITEKNYNLTQIKHIILNIDQKNGTTFFQEPYKVENIKNINFDYNSSLIMLKLLQ